jgi:hypothetical protein
VARWLKIDPGRRCARRSQIPRPVPRGGTNGARQDRSLSEMSDRELDDLWNAAKQQIG